MDTKAKTFTVRVIMLWLIASTINLFSVSSVVADVVDYDIVYVRMPRNGDNQTMNRAEVINPVNGRIDNADVIRN